MIHLYLFLHFPFCADRRHATFLVLSLQTPVLPAPQYLQIPFVNAVQWGVHNMTQDMS